MAPATPESGGRVRSATAELIRAGLADAARGAKLLAELAGFGLDLAPAALGGAADPDLALLTLARIASAAPGRDGLARLWPDQRALGRLTAVVGGSAALGDHLVRHPEHLTALSGGDALKASDAPDAAADDFAAPTERQLAFRAALLRAVGADPDAQTPVAASAAPEPLRLAYRRALLGIAADDLANPAPTELFPLVASALADLATAVLDAALAVARSGVDAHDQARLAVIAMGKAGGRELNYVSDVDVVYVAAPSGPAVAEPDALATAAQLAAGLQRVVFGPAGEPPIWQVDPNLRPEGKNGPLTRTLESHLAYYRKWAQTWEFQALLKARPAAGDMALARRYYEATRPFVWHAVESENFVEDAQAMRRRVEEHVPPAEAERQIKLGRGGLRDVEFTVQLLQLVHGRSDPAIRTAGTLSALEALRDGGYVGRAAAARLAACYRLARVLEHRVQLQRLRRTHLMPTGESDLRRLARAARIQPPEGAALERIWQAARREVRSLHEELYYRPLLPATAKLTAGEATLAPGAARDRLGALGYRHPDGALRHIAALTSGVTRQAAIQRQLLPVMLGWFADGADPDAGLLSFRRLSEALGSTHWYLRMLRDSAGAAERLSHALAASKFVAENLARSPESARWFESDRDLEPRQAADLSGELAAVIERRESAATAATAVRSLRRRELTRLATAMALRQLDDGAARFAVSAIAGVALAAAFELAVEAVAVEDGERLADVAVIAMGSLGGREMAFGSDADVVFVHRARVGADEAAAQNQAQAVASRLRSLLGGIGPEPALEIDADLRPEGRVGPLSRSVAAYREYYGRWALTWERQALLRARPVAGDAAVAGAFMEVAGPVRYRPGGLGETELKDLRLLKARIDAERLPRGVEPARHVKLGPGGLLDVQWVAQLYQLRHAAGEPGLRVTGTVEALEAAAAAGLMDSADAQILIESWMQAMSIRNANVLWTGRMGPTSDVVPSDPHHLRGVAGLMGYRRGAGQQLTEDRARLARRAHQVFDRLFYS
ncbi:MAG: bifunctional [glutamine synthetase] adenylyltransferase/[glutamine synthetase]-adenylyl-L-tyrosine phosphorylase [Bifidobacteriaceae bacterium]|jgi:glutamate-ammonia-ligase adenylyltransferase|nr:bifunctional [glutamine synthetase] adenylyltransferase/[glutamine synthetase]-adenylyl-L-tyrosine phosphorylase [Bifidobacteriaceae bacterium]